jgi:murein DD-endopeptidase MepM/ murein hydrolase activator NlpD
VSGSPVQNGRISSRFGYRIDPETGRRQLHRGLDFGGQRGSVILALADGVVTFAGRNGGYGNLVELEHPNGYRTRYAHNETLLVHPGERVNKGQSIATMGSTGRSTGTHLHVEVRHEGRAVDPQLYIR